MALLFAARVNFMSHEASTSNGTVEVHSVEWMNENGASMHAVLYVPESATAANPVPGIVANHGFTSNSEAMHLHAIEMSRRGYVVIALDAYGHGSSSYPDMSIEGAGINSRFFFKKTGSIWVGGILNGLLVTFAAICGTCIMLPA